MLDRLVMLPVALALVLALLVVCSFAPGFFVVRRLPWTPLEKLCGAVALSLVLIYLAGWIIYCFGPPDERPAYWIVAAAAAALGVRSLPDLRRMLRSSRVRQAVAGFIFLLLIFLTALCAIRVYSGARWVADWYEHFHRSLFFLHRLPTGVTIFPGYPLPARPPLMNVLAAFFLGLTRDQFPIFQVVFVFLNLLLFLPCVLLVPALGGTPRRSVLPLAVLFAASPVVMENVTYTWTKSLAAFFVVVALAFYLAGWRKRESTRTAMAFLAGTAGLLAHYSAGPYVLFLSLHYAWRMLRQRQLWREAALTAAACGLLLATWFGWSARVYGLHTTLASNTSVSSSQNYDGSNAVKIAANLFDTVVPAWLRGEMEPFPQANSAGEWRDRAFTFYQLNLIFAMGVVGGPLVLWLLWRSLICPSSGRPARERNFWRAMVPFSIVLGIAVVGERDVGGVPHLTLLAVEALGLTLIAANFRCLSRTLRALVVIGCLVDFNFGILLQTHIESLENTPGRMVFPGLAYNSGSVESNDNGHLSLSKSAWGEWVTKHRVELVPDWLERLPRGRENDPQFGRFWPRVRLWLQGMVADDRVNWGGWAARHGGVVQHLGDWVAGPSGGGCTAAVWAMTLLFLGLIAALARKSLDVAHDQVPTIAPVRSPPAKSGTVRARRARSRRTTR